VMVWALPPDRAGWAPHASRHSKFAEVAGAPGVGSGEAFAIGPCEQAPAVIARPALPAKWSSCRRLTTFGLSSDWSGERASIEVTITIKPCYGRWCGGASSRSQSSFEARRTRSSSPNLSKSSGVTCTRGGFGAAGGGGSGSMVVIVPLLRRAPANREVLAVTPLV